MNNYKIIDGHCDTLMLFDNDKYNFHIKNDIGHLDLDRLIDANVLLQFFAVYVDPKFLGQALETGLSMSNQLLRAITDDPRIFLIKESIDLNNLREGKVGALLSLEGGEVINKNLHLLDVFYNLGARAMTLTWSNRNWICDGIAEPSGSGLTSFGRQVVKRMDELGMIIDVSHISIKGFWDCIDLSTRPILASHSNSKVLCNHCRNLSDDQIKAIAQSKGLVAVNYVPSHLANDPKKASIETIIDHIKYIADLVGIEHVGLGSDFDGVSTLPVGIKDVRDSQKLAKSMLNRGFMADDIEKVFYKNFFNYLSITI